MKQAFNRARRLRFESLEERRMLTTNWVVTTQNDYSSWDETDSVLSLREAVSRAEDGDTITFSSSLASTGFTIKYGEMNVAASITIDASSWRTAAGTNRITLNASSRSRIFNVAEDAALTLTALDIKNGYTSGDGGAIYTKGDVILNGCQISFSQAQYGGAIFSFHGSVTINSGSVSNCSSTLHGGAIYAYHGSLTIDGCTIDGNRSQTAGGLDCSDAVTTIRNSVISNNRSTDGNYFAGGIFVHGGYMSIADSQIIRNISYNYGGGMYIHDAEVDIANTLIANNQTMYSGGGIENFGWLTLTQCTIAGNRTTGDYSGGAGIYNYYGSGMYVKAYNCIFAENTCASGKTACNYQGNGYGYGYNILTSTTEDWTSISNYFEYDSSLPLFSDLDAQDYTLTADSQAVNLGDNSYACYEDGSAIMYDLAGKDRIYGSSVDLGAYEYNPKLPLSVPANVKTASAGANRIRVTWDEVENSTGYHVAWSSDRINWSQGITAETSLRVTGLTYGTAYYFKVKAIGDNTAWADSDYSASVSRIVCPADVDGDGFIGPGDNAILSAAWFKTENSANWDERCDIDGDGFVGPGDRSYLSVNWFKMTNQEGIVYPPALAIIAEQEDSFASLDAELEEILEQMI